MGGLLKGSSCCCCKDGLLALFPTWPLHSFGSEIDELGMWLAGTTAQPLVLLIVASHDHVHSCCTIKLACQAFSFHYKALQRMSRCAHKRG